MRTIQLANEKGGVGKTTLAVTIAGGLAQRGKRVLLVDTDAQGHATRAAGLAKFPGLYDLLVRDADWQDVIRPASPAFWGAVAVEGTDKFAQEDYRLWVLGSNQETVGVTNNINDAWKLATRLEDIAQRFDYAIIDTSPTPSLLHSMIFLASDFLVYPTQAELLSFDGLLSSLTHRRAYREFREVKIGGIVPTMIRAQTWEHAQMLRSLRKEYGDLVWPEISESIVWAEASRAARAVFAYRPDHQAAAQAWTLVDHVEALS